MTTLIDVETNGANSSAIEAASMTVSSPAATPETKATTAIKVALPTLKMGQGGEAVRFLQQRLQSFEYRIAFNGQFGLQIDAAVKHFQAHYGGLLVDGVVGAKTWKALCENSQLYGYSFYSEFVATTYPYDVHMPTLQKGMEGNAVECLQRRLIAYTYRLKVDGIFGDATKAAVTSHQKRVGLKADGIVGRQTWRELGLNLAP